MCGIAGYIGKSKKPKVSYDLITNIFAHLESRGTDAAGIWGLESKNKPKVIYHKAPIKSSEFIQIPIWQKVEKVNPDLLLIHARKTSPGIGHARFNENNHPFASEDRRIGVIHNGKIHEASFLEDKYATKTDCDSEILLRMYEHSLNEPPMQIENVPSYMLERLSAIQELWSVLKQGSCASMIGELHDDGSRTVMLFRNEKRPLWVADLRETLGQIFFFSSIDIWNQAVTDCDYLKEIGPQKLAELPINEVWGLKIDEKNPIVIDENFHRIKMKIDRSFSYDWIAGTEKKPIQGKKMNLSVITDLDEKENAPYQVPERTLTGTKPNTPSDCDYAECDRWNQSRYGHHVHSFFNEKLEIEEEDDDSPPASKPENNFQVWRIDDDRDYVSGEWLERDDCRLNHGVESVNALCEDIRNLIDQIETNFSNSVIEGNIGPDDLEELINSLKQTEQDLEGTALFLNC